MSEQPFNLNTAEEQIVCPSETTVYYMNLHPIGTAFLDRPGVYIFLRRGVDRFNWQPIYIGETESLERRLTKQLTYHHKWDRIRAAGATHVATMHVPEELGLAIREAIETDIRRVNPTPCNDQ